jgi:hypothetical protein
MGVRKGSKTCNVCGQGEVQTRDEELAFHQWTTDRGYVFCRVTMPVGTCDHCGAKSWSENADAIIHEAVQKACKDTP